MEQMGNAGRSNRETWQKPEIIKAAFSMREIIKNISIFNQKKIPVEEKFFKMTEKYGPQLSVLGLSIASIYDEGRSEMDKPVMLVVDDTMKFIDYLSFLESTDEVSLVENLSYILLDVDDWFLKQIDKNLQKPKFMIGDVALDYLSQLDVILKKLETMEKKWKDKSPGKFLGIDVRKLRALIKFRDKDSLDVFFDVFSKPADFDEIERFNENPESFMKYLSKELSEKKYYEHFILNKMKLLDRSLESLKYDPKYENIFNYVYSFLDKIINDKNISNHDNQIFKVFLEDRKQRLERIIQERK